MEKPYQTEQVGRYIVALYPDDEPQNPCEEWDMVGTLLCWYSRYNLGHGGSWGKEHRYDTPEEFLILLLSDEVRERLEKRKEKRNASIPFGEWMKRGDELDREWTGWLMDEALKVAVILPLYLYEHGGMTIRTTTFYDRLDSGQVGYIYVTAEEARKEFGRQWRNKAEHLLRLEVGEYDDYLTGNCWGYRIFVAPEGVDEAFQVHSFDDLDEVDSCWGFLGDKEYCLEEARSLVRTWKRRRHERTDLLLDAGRDGS